MPNSLIRRGLMKNSEWEFRFYRSGSHTADFIFGESGVRYRLKDIETGEWPAFGEFDLASSAFDGLMPAVLQCLSKSEAVNWKTDDEILLPSGKSYSRYMKIEGNADGLQSAAWIWAMQGSGLPVDIVESDGSIIGFIMTARDRCNILVKPGYESLTPLRQWDDPLISRDCHKVKNIGTYNVITRDGTSLATDVWLPCPSNDSERYPTIFIRTPYGRYSSIEFWHRFVRRGYALVIQDVRGRDDSNGEWVPYKYDREDGDDTLNWIADQPWSDGNVGMTGASYLGNVQWAAAASGNPHLKALVSMVTSGPSFIDIERRGGIYSSGSLAWAFMMADKSSNKEALKRDDWNEVAAMRPIKDIPQRALGRNIHFWDEHMQHPNNDEFWQNIDWTLDSDKINVPALIISGWYDDNGMGSTTAWEMNEGHKRENQKLIFGPWFHQFNSTREIHGVSFGSTAIRYDLDVLCLRWFDRFLKNIDNGVETEPAVQYYMVGANQWEKAEKWPPEQAVYKNAYIHSSGNAKTSSGDGKLDFTTAEDEPYDTYVFDPKDPALFLIDVSENEMNVPENYREVDKREDVLVYTSSPLESEVAIAGNIFAEIYAASSARDTDWVVRLEDVDNKGNSIRLTDGILRARYRRSFEKPELLEPGAVEKYEIRMAKTANVFKKGHSIRITITSGAKNLAFPNHNTGNNVPDDVEMLCATQKMYHNEQYPSHVKLPIMRGSVRQKGL
jgi:uncharacterized protein